VSRSWLAQAALELYLLQARTSSSFAHQQQQRERTVSPSIVLVVKRNYSSNSIHQTTAAATMDFLKDFNIDKVRNLAEDA
jgi:hypothetical protein